MFPYNLIDKYIKEIDTTLKLRTLAAERLQRNDFWLQICNIYYSCFTAILALLSIKEGSSFLTVPSAIFTVTVAILVTFSNSLKYAHRASDLRANCDDLKISYMELTSFKFELINTRIFDDSCNQNLNIIINDYLQKLNDSEYHGISDVWKLKNPIKYALFYCFPLIIFWIFLFILPILFIIWRYSDFYFLFY